MFIYSCYSCLAKQPHRFRQQLRLFKWQKNQVGRQKAAQVPVCTTVNNDLSKAMSFLLYSQIKP